MNSSGQHSVALVKSLLLLCWRYVALSSSPWVGLAICKVQLFGIIFFPSLTRRKRSKNFKSLVFKESREPGLQRPISMYSAYVYNPPTHSADSVFTYVQLHNLLSRISYHIFKC